MLMPQHYIYTSRHRHTRVHTPVSCDCVTVNIKCIGSIEHKDKGQIKTTIVAPFCVCGIFAAAIASHGRHADGAVDAHDLGVEVLIGDHVRDEVGKLGRIAETTRVRHLAQTRANKTRCKLTVRKQHDSFCQFNSLTWVTRKSSNSCYARIPVPASRATAAPSPAARRPSAS